MTGYKICPHYTRYFTLLTVPDLVFPVPHTLYSQCVVRLEYSLGEASVIIEELSNHWDCVREHLNQVVRLPTYRFHMREVILFSEILLSLIYIFLFQPNTLDECFRLDTAHLARLFIIRCVQDHC